MIFGEVRPCESEVFREITAAEARVWREPVYLVVPQWYQQEYHALSGYQEAMVLVKGGYAPDLIVVQHGRPVRLKFRREESAACSEMVIFSDFGKSARLPEGEMVPIEFLPERPGEYEFTCQMGMLRGRLVVE
ncbi:MAG: cupredoxin domain-containing protein [Deinococcus sp.]|nr:cupredoxin domain-containing protein [Deinococcus sp.]